MAINKSGHCTYSINCMNIGAHSDQKRSHIQRIELSGFVKRSVAILITDQ